MYRDPVVCPPVYDRLAALCDRSGYWLELAHGSGTFELRVKGKTKNAGDVIREPMGPLTGLEDAARRLLWALQEEK